jgi:hypothetical protein
MATRLDFLLIISRPSFRLDTFRVLVPAGVTGPGPVGFANTIITLGVQFSSPTISVEGLLARVNAARERLAKVPALGKRFRKSVLAAACSGKLTEEWRDARGPSWLGGPSVEVPSPELDEQREVIRRVVALAA